MARFTISAFAQPTKVDVSHVRSWGKMRTIKWPFNCSRVEKLRGMGEKKRGVERVGRRKRTQIDAKGRDKSLSVRCEELMRNDVELIRSLLWWLHWFLLCFWACFHGKCECKVMFSVIYSHELVTKKCQPFTKRLNLQPSVMTIYHIYACLLLNKLRRYVTGIKWKFKPKLKMFKSTQTYFKFNGCSYWKCSAIISPDFFVCLRLANELSRFNELLEETTIFLLLNSFA
jgi:hypothetical protein